MRNLILICLTFLFIVSCNKNKTESLKSFMISDVKILEGPFYQAQQTDMQYILEMDPDRLLAPYLIDAGFEPVKERYGNWENSGLDGHIGGHYLSALSLMYAATGNEELLQRLNYMIDWIKKCQDKNGNGYVGGIPDSKKLWEDIANGEIDASNFSLNNRWVPLYNIHKLFAGLRDAWLITRNETAKEILIKLTDWCLELTKNLSDEEIQQMLRSEHGGLNEVFADVSVISGNEKYLDLAQKFSHRVILDPLIKGKNELTGLHGNTQIPKVIGYKRIADLTGNTDWANAAEFFWNTIVNKWSVSIGGNSVREHFHSVDDFSSMVESNQGLESCNTYNMLKLTNLLFSSNPDKKYLEYYERALFNHILSSQHPEKGGFVYFSSMRPRHYRVYSQPHQGFWCCVGSGLENHGKYGELIYAHNDKDVFVNLFIASKLNWKEKGISIIQNTKFPYEEKSEIELKLENPQKFEINIRYPEWVKKGDLKLSVNGKNQRIIKKSFYVSLNHEWKDGDIISITLPMHTKIEYLPDGLPWASIVHGPVVLGAATDTTDLIGIWADDSRMGHVANGPLYPIENAPMIISEDKEFSDQIIPVKDKPLTFTINGIIYPDQYKNIELVPFFSIHEARYVVYWPVTNAEGLERKKQKIQEKEKEMLELEKITIDQVETGEQQPEVEHNFKGENTESGIFEGKHWRHARGWFSYDLDDKNQEGKFLLITYSAFDKGRTFDIIINANIIETIKLEGSETKKFYSVQYNIPENIAELSKNGKMNVKFVAHDNSIAGGIYHIRLLKSSYLSLK